MLPPNLVGFSGFCFLGPQYTGLLNVVFVSIQASRLGAALTARWAVRFDPSHPISGFGGRIQAAARHTPPPAAKRR